MAKLATKKEDWSYQHDYIELSQPLYKITTTLQLRTETDRVIEYVLQNIDIINFVTQCNNLEILKLGIPTPILVDYVSSLLENLKMCFHVTPDPEIILSLAENHASEEPSYAYQLYPYALNEMFCSVILELLHANRTEARRSNQYKQD